MYAIVEIAGQQFKVEKDQKLYVHRLEGDEGAKVEFDNVLLIDDKGKIKVGTPVVNGALVTAKIIQHMKGDKVIVFKKKRRKGYQVKNGHRQYLSEIEIENIQTTGNKKKAAEKKEAPISKEAKPTVKEEKPKKEGKTREATKPTVKKTTKPKEKKETKTVGTKEVKATKESKAKKDDDKSKEDKSED